MTKLQDESDVLWYTGIHEGGWHSLKIPNLKNTCKHASGTNIWQRYFKNLNQKWCKWKKLTASVTYANLLLSVTGSTKIRNKVKAV